MNNDNNNKAVAIMDMAIKISQNSAADIFVYYSAHTNSMDIEGYSEGWRSGKHRDLFKDANGYSLFIPLDERAGSRLDRVLAELEALWEGILKSKEAAA